MREIKFRGRRVDNGEWVFGDFHYGILTKSVFINVNEVDSETVGQYTGLKDQNGAEIYEGDIIGFYDCTSTESGYWERSCMGVVEWCGETVSFEVSNRLSAESYEVFCECVVAGNIYENPELLEWRARA
jgi:uncharacterized phage protein (TIGR01671 family)